MQGVSDGSTIATAPLFAPAIRSPRLPSVHRQLHGPGGVDHTTTVFYQVDSWQGT